IPLRPPKVLSPEPPAVAATFDALLMMIQDDLVFHSNSNKPQLPVPYQLAIFLFRISHNGNASSVESIAQWAGHSAGAVVSCTANGEEIANAKAWVGEASCFAQQHGYCMVDGTLVPLADKPGFHGEAYFDHKSNYSLNVQIVNLPNYQIIDYVVGPVAVHTTLQLSERHPSQRTPCIGLPVVNSCGGFRLCPPAMQPENKTFNYYLLRLSQI
ncbi:hypothetical protein BS47DRAFT_1370068, partial [Hydnum rufescens UP504]